VYIPEAVTDMLCEVDPLLHELLLASFEVSNTLPPEQNVVAPFALITGADGMTLGAAIPPAAELVHPLATVWVTV
jgi:hypothetical protein